MKRLALVLLVLASLTFAPTVLASPPSASGWVGNWTSLDCFSPAIGVEPDCDLYGGDGSTQTLHIGPGERPRANYADSYATECFNNGFPATRYVAANGIGEYAVYNYHGEDFLFLFLFFEKAGCGLFGMSDAPLGMGLIYDEASDTLWQDDDEVGFGTVWTRTN